MNWALLAVFLVCFGSVKPIVGKLEIRRPYNRVLGKLATAPEVMSEWDAVNGVWKGDKAVARDDLPNPLYLFGYGSLLWRPGDLLGGLPAYAGSVPGWTRLFAQRSCDHRGCSEFPGMVVTMVETSFLEEAPSVHPQGVPTSSVLLSAGIDVSPNSACDGAVWIIPEEQAEATIAELDFREKGGYHRHIIKVKLREDTPYHAAGAEVEAIVYSGSTSNPNFDLLLPRVFPHPPVSEPVLRSPSPSASAKPSSKSSLGPRFHIRNPTADIIAAAVGPSGPNHEYLFRLCDFISENGMDDAYLSSLSDDVALRMGPWRARRGMKSKFLKGPSKTSHLRNLNSNHPSSVGERSTQKIGITQECHGSVLLGWGSDEFGQLLDARSRSGSRSRVDSKPTQEQLSKKKADEGIPDDLVPSATLLGLPAVVPSDEDIALNRYQERPKPSQVVCGGAVSAFLSGDTSTLYMWGKQIKNQSKQQHQDKHKPDEAQAAIGAQVFKVDDVVGVAVGHEHQLVLHKSGWVVSMGDDTSGQCAGPSSFIKHLGSESKSIEELQLMLAVSPAPEVSILKVAAGVRHSAAITTDGRLFVWGAGPGATMSPSNVSADMSVGAYWQPPAPEGRKGPYCKLIDVTCGLNHTIAVDEFGRIWSFGDNKHGSLGRAVNGTDGEGSASAKASDSAAASATDGTSSKSTRASTRISTKDSEPKLVTGLEAGVRWQRVTSGWSHTIARGVRPDGSEAFCAWGRNDLGQYPITDAPGNTVHSLAPLPNGREIREVWAGSEFTIVADEMGYLWSCGWNEHGNLSRAPFARQTADEDDDGAAGNSNGAGAGAEATAEANTSMSPETSASPPVEGTITDLRFASSSHWVPVVAHRGELTGYPHAESQERGIDTTNPTADTRNESGSEARAVTEDEHRHLRLRLVWEGALSCGGGHCVCLASDEI